MVGETRKVMMMAQAAADTDTALKAAVSHGDDGAVVARLFEAAAPAERNAAFVVACARGREAALVLFRIKMPGRSPVFLYESEKGVFRIQVLGNNQRCEIQLGEPPLQLLRRRGLVALLPSLQPRSSAW